MILPPLVRLNGKAFTRQSVAVRLNGLFRIVGIDNIKWDDETPTELVSGMNDQGMPVGKATGNYTCSASMAVYLDEAELVDAYVLGSNPTAGTNLSAANFQLLVSMREDVRFLTVAMVNCNIKKRGVTVGSGGEALVREYDLQPTAIIENGKSLVNILPSL